MPPAQIANAAQAKLLLDPVMLVPIHALMKSPLSAAELARQLALPLRRICTLLDRLHRVGIAEIQEERPRAGRAVKVYAVHPLWRVPFEFTRALDLQDLMWFSMRHYQQRLNHLLAAQMQAHAPEWDYWLSPGRIYPTPADNAGDLFGGPEPAHCMIGGLLLTDAEAREFKRRLLALQYEYEALSTAKRSGTKPYALGLTFTRGQWWGDETDEDCADQDCADEDATD